MLLNHSGQSIENGRPPAKNEKVSKYLTIVDFVYLIGLKRGFYQNNRPIKYVNVYQTNGLILKLIDGKSWVSNSFPWIHWGHLVF